MHRDGAAPEPIRSPPGHRKFQATKPARSCAKARSQQPRNRWVWNLIPDDVRARVVRFALDEPELSARELAVRFTNSERNFVSEASVWITWSAREQRADCLAPLSWGTLKASPAN